jgi:hypothetical protein
MGFSFNIACLQTGQTPDPSPLGPFSCQKGGMLSNMISEPWQQTLLQEGENSTTGTKSPNFPAILHVLVTEEPVLCWAECNEPSIVLCL